MIENRYGTTLYKSLKIHINSERQLSVGWREYFFVFFCTHSPPYIVCAALLCLLSISSLFHHHPAFE